MSWQDYTQIQEDLQALIKANISLLNAVLTDADARDISANNVPLVDIRYVVDEPAVRVGQAYYNQTTLDLEVITHSLESQHTAAMVRNSILRSIADLLRANPHFSATLETVKIGPIAFDAGMDRQTGAFVAAAVMRVYVEAYVD